MSDTCSSCRYWVPNDEPQGITSDYGWGHCRRWPPSVVGRTVTTGDPRERVTLWPITTGDLGCGEHKEKSVEAVTPTAFHITPTGHFRPTP